MTVPMHTRSDASVGGGSRDLATQAVGLLRSELRKTYSTSAWWAMLIPAALLSLMVNIFTTYGGGLSVTPALGMALALGMFSAKLAVVYGVVCASGEFRHRTITTSYLTAPGRAMLIAAKAVVAALVGAVYAVVSALAGLLGALVVGGWAEGQTGPLLAVGGVAMLTFALWAALGVGVATVIGSQLVAITGVLVYLLLAEQILIGLAHVIGIGDLEGYLPGGASEAALTELAGDDTLGGSLLGLGTVPWWLALTVFAGYAVVAVLAGAAVAQRRDIT
jgi:ABC-type transport system involved in multi-copper enzyme maturation permease subunit